MYIFSNRGVNELRTFGYSQIQTQTLKVKYESRPTPKSQLL